MIEQNSRGVAFIVMPFSKEFDAVYGQGIRPACVAANLTCARVDEQVFLDHILSRIYTEVAAADLVIADLSGRNPNVFYEVGYAHALGKRVVLLAQSIAEVPFDLNHYPNIVYGDDLEFLRTELTKKVIFLLGHPSLIPDVVQNGFPWPALVRRGMSLLSAARDRYTQLRDVSMFVSQLPGLAHSFGARGAQHLQLSLIDSHRKILVHDYTPLEGMPAIRMGVDGSNVYDEVFRYDHGTVAWIDAVSNIHRTPHARRSLAIFSAVGDTGMRLVVELHDELR
jgi:hypothetical protein